MAVDNESVLNRIDELEQRAWAQWSTICSQRDVLDNEIRSLEHRLDEAREETGGLVDAHPLRENRRR